ncbi:GntR family transcriptional regulator [Kribbella sandramycini]|uniref:GntR family transcriptional regulator n=1 Tax=Kribbella sandramycini TaxID=60450 RepID=A0A7Y4P4R1_9ACTN|nr:GntR family transcriptional regulator [Kribbella sandramycini]MBB6566697.1 GntR family transcriptional regulator [Kribbella sandramycini]NOL45484.1 GntR family transcriptional regulator [Kribbella sandramycini]
MAKQPLYERIVRELLIRIDELDDGTRVPSEPQLAAEFGVSRMTARAALSTLERDGLLERVPGRGSFVRKSPTTRRAAQLLSFHDQAIAAGKTPRSQVLAADRRAPTAVEARALGGPAEVIAITRIRLMDEMPIAVEEAAFIPELAELLNADLTHDSAHDTIRRLGFTPANGRAVFGAREAGEHARHLGVTPHAALLTESRTIFDADGRPLEHTTSSYIPSRYTLDVDFTIHTP